jgi:transcriptional regulator with XRE-family HTH domain
MNETFISQIGVRLEEERKRLGLKSQQAAGDACGVSREIWGKYERGIVMPGGEVLFSFAAAGADVQYILTGIRSNMATEQHSGYAVLNPRETMLLDNYRHIADEEDKRCVERTALLAAKADKKEGTNG